MPRESTFARIHALDLSWVQEYLTCDPTVPSGLRWLKSPTRSVKAGSAAGNPDAKTGYYSLKIKLKPFRTSHIVLILNGFWPEDGQEADHVDRNVANNCVSNLRWVSKSVNLSNRHGYGASRYKYVRKHHSGPTWIASYRHPITKKSVHVGVYATELQAHNAAVAHRESIPGVAKASKTTLSADLFA